MSTSYESGWQRLWKCCNRRRIKQFYSASNPIKLPYTIIATSDVLDAWATKILITPTVLLGRGQLEQE